MKKGKFIVFEGVSGTGKETQAKLLSAVLKKQYGITSSVIFHPTPELKNILHDWRHGRDIGDDTEVYLLLADRSNRVARGILPALANGQWIISLRNYVSALVYQGKTPENRRWIKKEFESFEPTPDVLYHFHISPKDALERIQRRHKLTGEAFGKFETLSLLEEKNKKYREVLSDIPHIPIDAAQSIEKIHGTIMDSLQTLLSKKGQK